ncbi:fungal specific transcription factor domain-containing protein [Aspergillus candidus]|uniref:Putative C6 transcription factor n=1 Tax=Aspergillus candidus TaxID=41067 RepID=A0A2I2FE39_ASPCN|nr:putative C6 transcription factor [Aspergillus candidus]PLB38867.1 putative C6 transcription factor [Aspergillus candidus]
MQTECVISDPFRREHKRRRMSELQHETNELRRKLRSSSASDVQQSPIAMLTVAAEMGVHGSSSGTDLPLTPQSHIVPPVSYHQRQTTPSNGGIEPSLTRMVGQIMPADYALDPTESRALDNIDLSGSEINELFELFFQQYAHFLPILDPQSTPNAYYTQSPFLFWAIIGVGCRTYAKNPTLLTALAAGIIDKALLSVGSTLIPWQTIQGLLLLLTWPFPKDPARPDLTFILSGLLLHIAMQHGLHIPMSSHEFSKIKLPTPSETDMVRRSELWAHCVITYQRSCMIKGQAPRSLVDFEHDLGQRQSLFRRIEPSLILQMKCQDVIARCSGAVQEIGVRAMTTHQEKALDILLREFENQVIDLGVHTDSANDRLHISVCRLSVQAFHFFKDHTIVTTNCLPRLVNTSCVVIDATDHLSQSLGGLANAPQPVFFGLLLSAITLLRIIKVFSSQSLSLERARSGYFTAINLLKLMSVDNNDTSAKTVHILNQLWNSQKAFRRPDGTICTVLRIRSRLALSPVVDAVWWWRDEYDIQGRAVNPSQSVGSDGNPTSHKATRVSGGAIPNLPERQEPILFDEQFLADFEWALCDNGILVPTEPFGLTLPSTGAVL